MKLPSGAELKVTLAPFADSRALYQAVLAEMKGLKLDPKQEIDATFWKDVFCTILSSKKIERAIWKCMTRATYCGLKIDENTFEPKEARDDYFYVMKEVAKENLLPFTKSLGAEYSAILENLKPSLASRQPTKQT